MSVFTLTQFADSGGSARRGTLHTRRGDLTTPFFMPDATRASVRGITNEQLVAAGIDPMVVNTYHLYLQPGADFIARAGGVHHFMGWDGPLLSDSSGYQVFSLIHKNPQLGHITEHGAEFRSILDGSKHLITPARAMQIQCDFGTDMMVVLDDPRPNTVSDTEMEASVERTIRWAQESKDAFEAECHKRGWEDGQRPLLFAVVQGGKSTALREYCARALAKIGFDGYSFGGRHVDEHGVFMTDVMRATAAAIPQDAPRFALGIGTPEDIAHCYALGWDFFDCVIPTREGRHGRLFVYTDRAQGISLNNGVQHFYQTLNITNERFKEDFTPIDTHCDCYCCQHYSRAYIQHLFRAKEPLGPQMASVHNLRFYTQLMEALRTDQDVASNTAHTKGKE